MQGMQSLSIQYNVRSATVGRYIVERKVGKEEA